MKLIKRETIQSIGHADRSRCMAAFGIVVSFALCVCSCSSSLKIIDKPISFSSDRIALTKEYIKEHYGGRADSITIIPTMIVVHWTAIPSLQKSFDEFDKEMLDSTRADIQKAGMVNVSIQFLVDTDGTVYRLMPETWMARHVIGLNLESIGIENVGGSNGVDNLTDEQLAANEKLIRYVKKKYPSIEYLSGHYEYTRFVSTGLWMEKDSSYRTEKTDPGKRFMTLLRNRLDDLHFRGAP
jgi:N-acetylmuramoyl-L-alanine amidase